MISMENARGGLRFALFMVAAILALAACERPLLDREVSPTAEATPGAAPIFIPTLTPTPQLEAPPDGEAPGPAGEPATETPAGEPAAQTPGAQTPGTETPGGEAAGETPGTPAEGATQLTYIVQAGDTLGRIAQQYNVSIEALAQANGILNIHQLDVGQVLVIPVAGSSPAAPAEPAGGATEERIHVVQPGETLYRIGLQYGFTYQELATYNGIADPTRIDVGQEIRIPPSG